MDKEIKEPFIVKYDYDDMYGFGSMIVFAKDEADAVLVLRDEMEKNQDKRWLDRTIRGNRDFRFITKSIYDWYTYYNNEANVCVKVRRINRKFGNIPIGNNFEEGAP